MNQDFRTWEAWRNTHQPFELEWWQQALAAGHDGLPEHFDEIRAFVKPHGKVIDIGCGPRPAYRPCVVIDPLADEYQKITPPEWWSGVRVYAQPAEEPIHNLYGDCIVCWNALDHAIGWQAILRNMRAYGYPGARYVVATDFFEPFVGHPGFRRDEFEAVIDAYFTVVEKREPLGRQLALMMVAKG